MKWHVGNTCAATPLYYSYQMCWFSSRHVYSSKLVTYGWYLALQDAALAFLDKGQMLLERNDRAYSLVTGRADDDDGRGMGMDGGGG